MNYIKAFILSIGGFFLPVVPLLLLVGLFILSDTVLGVWSANKMGEAITSRKLGNIIPKMLLYQAAVLVGYVLDVYLVGEFIKFIFSVDMLFTKMIAMTLIFVESLSINENFESITGKNIFRSFKVMITRAKVVKKELNNI